MGEIIDCITEIKMGNKEKFTDLLVSFEPLLNKYTRCLYKDEQDDVKAELACALWEAITKIEYVNQEGQTIMYLKRAVLNRYMELYRMSRKINDNELRGQEECIETNYVENDYEVVMVEQIINAILKKYTGKKYEIVRSMIIDEYSDSEIGKKYSVSRQYVNRIRRELKKIYEKGFL